MPGVPGAGRVYHITQGETSKKTLERAMFFGDSLKPLFKDSFWILHNLSEKEKRFGSKGIYRARGLNGNRCKNTRNHSIYNVRARA